MSLNALQTACNQRTGRDPVTDYGEAEVRAGLDALKAQQLVRAEYARGSRVPKYAQRLNEQLDLDDAQVAVLALLLLRGPQTVGELRSRSERMHDFADLTAVEDTLRTLAEHKFGALVAPLPRQAGQKEVRWQHLLGPDDDAARDRPQESAHAPPAAAPSAAAPRTADGDAVAALRGEVAALRQEVAALRAELASLRGA